MSTLRVDTITDEAGTGPVEFTNGINVSGGTVTGVEPFKYNAVSGATQALDVGTYNFFDAGTLTADTTVSFSNVPTEARWTYTAIGAANEAFTLSQISSLGTAVTTESPFNYIYDGAIKTGGDKLYLLTSQNEVMQYSITNGRLNTLTDDGVSISLTQPTSGYTVQIYFKYDGTAFYVVDKASASKKVFQYSMSTAWDLTTFSYVGASPTLSAVTDSLQGLTFSSDGTKMYVSRGDNVDIYQYTLSSAWNVSSATYASKTFSVVSQGTGVRGLGLSADGTKLFALLNSNNTVFQYTLSTPYDLSTASYSTLNVTTPYASYNELGLIFDPDGLSLGVVISINSSTVYIQQYKTYESATITFPSSVQNLSSSSPTLGNRNVYSFFTSDGGTTVWSGGY